MTGTTSRRIDLDALRIFACYLLIPFHTAMVFNPAPFYHVRNGDLSTPLMIFCGFVSLWHMPLLFLLAGWSAFASFRVRGALEFSRERARRLVLGEWVDLPLVDVVRVPRLVLFVCRRHVQSLILALIQGASKMAS